MAQIGGVGLDLIEGVGGDDGPGVVLSVHSALLQGGVQLGEGHGRGVRAHLGEHLNVQGGLHNANLQALHVVGGGDRALGVGQLPDAVFKVAYDADTGLLRNDVGDLVAHLAVKEIIARLAVLEQEGKTHADQLVGEAGVDGLAALGHLNLVSLYALYQLPAGADGVVVIDLHLEAAAGELLGHFLELEEPLGDGVLVGHRAADGDRIDGVVSAFGGGRGAGAAGLGVDVSRAAAAGLSSAGGQRQDHDQGQHQGADVTDSFHFSFLLKFLLWIGSLCQLRPLFFRASWGLSSFPNADPEGIIP